MMYRLPWCENKHRHCPPAGVDELANMHTTARNSVDLIHSAFDISSVFALSLQL